MKLLNNRVSCAASVIVGTREGERAGADLGQGALDGFALGIEHAFLQGNKHLGFHGQADYTSGAEKSVCGFAYGGYPNGPFPYVQDVWLSCSQSAS